VALHTGQPLHASPMSYAVNGKQYIAIAAGSDVLVLLCPKESMLLNRISKEDRTCFPI